MGWLDNIEGKLDDALDDVKEEIGERLEQAGASLFGNGNEGLGGGKITLTVDGLPLEPYALTADSFLSQISEYQFYCAVAVGVEAGSFLDKPAQWSCTSADGLSRDYAGKVTRIDQGRILPDGQEEWVLTVSSGLAALRQQSRYRIVHRRTVIELAEELLQEYGLTVTISMAPAVQTGVSWRLPQKPAGVAVWLAMPRSHCASHVDITAGSPTAAGFISKCAHRKPPP